MKKEVGSRMKEMFIKHAAVLHPNLVSEENIIELMNIISKQEGTLKWYRECNKQGVIFNKKINP